MTGSNPGFNISRARFETPALAPALYLVATPIGNLGDITLRALETIAAADILACEDTRVTRKLLDRYGIARKTRAYHEHNAAAEGPKLLAALGEGKSVALVSDAGTPLVSDPGFRLAAAAREAGHAVFPIPGASAPLAALVASGLPSDAFLFAGFLPAKAGARVTALEQWRGVPATLLFFESPNRLAASLAAMAQVYGAGRQAAVCRELTKMHEEVRPGPLGDLAVHYAANDARGEIVVVVAPDDAPAEMLTDAGIDDLLTRLQSEMGTSRAAAEAAKVTGRPKAELYRRLIEKDGKG